MKHMTVLKKRKKVMECLAWSSLRWERVLTSTSYTFSKSEKTSKGKTAMYTQPPKGKGRGTDSASFNIHFGQYVLLS